MELNNRELLRVNAVGAVYANPFGIDQIKAVFNIEDRIRRGNIVEVTVGFREEVEFKTDTNELTIKERYGIYLKDQQELQLSVLKEAAAHPDCFLRNSYTHVFVTPFSLVDHEFLDTMNVPRVRG